LREVRILLADDYEPWRQYVSSLLLKHPEWKIIGEVSDGIEAVRKCQELSPDVVLLDLNLPKINGVEAASHIRQSNPTTKIVFTTAYHDSDVMQTVLHNQADGYVLKWEVTRDLIAAVETALCGGKFVSKRLTDPPRVRL
jgi:DNA-binding NarL/FixJ family response regulator